MMEPLLRYLGLSLAVLAVALVAMVCGEVLCGACAHDCLFRSDRPVRAGSLMSRLSSAARQMVGSLVPAVLGHSSLVWDAGGTRTGRLVVPPEVPLRI